MSTPEQLRAKLVTMALYVAECLTALDETEAKLAKVTVERDELLRKLHPTTTPHEPPYSAATPHV